MEECMIFCERSNANMLKSANSYKVALTELKVTHITLGNLTMSYSSLTGGAL
jgi:hypothetical protein